MKADTILVAGIGNIFLGDDAFGVEVVQQLMQRELPEGVRVVDYGIRSFDLAYALMDDHDVVILVDATQQGRQPGTVYLIEPDLRAIEAMAQEDVNAHSMNPVRVLQLLESLGGGISGQLYLLGCEPEVLETEDGYLGLSKTVEAAVPHAINMILSFIDELRQDQFIKETGLTEA
jgi:hydrogenase maturation protease